MYNKVIIGTIKKSAILMGIMVVFAVPFARANQSSEFIESIDFAEELTPSQPRRLRIEVNVSDPDDIRVLEGQSILKGDILADRVKERNRLEISLRNTSLALDNIRESLLLPPTEPLPVPSIQNLPLPTFIEEETAVESAVLAYQQAERSYNNALNHDPLISQRAKISQQQQNIEAVKARVDNQTRKIESMRKINSLPLEVLLHEQEQLRRLNEQFAQAQAQLKLLEANFSQAQDARAIQLQDFADTLTNARNRVELAHARLQKARNDYSMSEYNHAINASRRIEVANQQQQQHSRQQLEYQAQLRDREFKITQLETQISDINNQLNSIAVVKSPYDGEIRRIRYERQTDNTLRVTLTLSVDEAR